MLATDMATLAGDARWLPHRLLDNGTTIRFVHADRQAQAAATFLDDASLGDERPRVDLRRAELDVAAVALPAPIHFIFHSAFARSTLLARALNLPGYAMGLKEPIILNDATLLLQAQRLSQETLNLTLRLLERPLAPGEAVVAKPSNAANPLIAELLHLRPRSRAIFLYRPLPDFLRSIARKGMFGRIWARRQSAAIRRDAPFDAGFSANDFLIHTDLQAAAYYWLVQQALFAGLAQNLPDRVRVLNADALIREPAITFSAVCAWFGLRLDAEAVSQAVSGPNFTEDSKRTGQVFDRLNDEGTAAVDEAEVRMVVDWLSAVANHVGVPDSFGIPLLARSP